MTSPIRSANDKGGTRSKLAALSSLSAQQLRLLGKVVAIIVAVAASGWLTSLAEKKREQVSDAKQRAAWAARAVAPQSQSFESFVSVWGASKVSAANAETLRWRAADARELAASLLAFDAINYEGRSVVRIDVKRQDGRFNVSAELAK